MKKRLSINLLVAGAILIGLFAYIITAVSERMGMRRLRMEITQGDQVVLSTKFAVPDREPPREFWQKAATVALDFDPKKAQLTVNGANPLRATLSGPVRIRLIHVSNLMTAASLTDLALQRNRPDSGYWTLAPEEIERARRAAGF